MRFPSSSLVRLAFVAFALLSGLAALPSAANAVPAFQRQTGLPCESCHVGGFGPQLTPEGQEFKLSGYGAASNYSKGQPAFDARLSAMIVGDLSHTQKDQPSNAAPDYRPNDNVTIQETSLFAAGRQAPDVGMFGQLTYSGVDQALALDNLDIRFAHAFKWRGKDTIFGVSVNNNPTSQDVWNSLPAWSFPYHSPDLAMQRAASPLIAGGLEQQVVGTTAYVWFNRSLYAEVGGYASPGNGFLDSLGLSQDARLGGMAPYWRLAYSGRVMQGTFSAGVFGMNARLAGDGAGNLRDRYNDLGVDATYQRQLAGGQTIAVNAAYVQENTNLAASLFLGDAARRRGELDSFTADASWRKGPYGLTLGGFKTTGSADAGIYAPEPGAGSRTGRPDSAGATLQADWTPAFAKGFIIPSGALRLGAQFTAYSKFNGASGNYDGFGRSAADNNTAAVFAWMAF